MRRIWIVSALLLACGCGAQAQPRAAVVATYTLPRVSLAQLGNPACNEAALARAKINGLKFSDLPSIGSGLARAGPNEFWGITDRGPNGITGDGEDGVRTFPLPQFCPTIFRLRLTGKEIQIVQIIPLVDSRGKRLSGLSNVKGEERLFESGEANAPLAYDQGGVDPEAIRVLPDGKFLVSEEYSPSILVAAPDGRVLMRYTPKSKPLPDATYPMEAILPEEFAERRDNKGFENLALSGDGKFAYALLQSPMGDAKDARYENSRVIRVVKLDVSDPLKAKVVAEYLALTSRARDYSKKQAQEKISWSDADWIAPEKLLVVEHGKGLMKLMLIDFSEATNILVHRLAAKLIFEASAADLGKLEVKPASAREVFSTRDVQGITSDKIEGLAILSPTEIALSNDNDFGIGENKNGDPSMIWTIRLATPLPVK
jgi:alkaline phosphatase